ncbi:thioredoxin domain-containing protein [PVC group bacterium]|nr:thioredoxin domain-containing protein [PVC group bacterium]
MAPSGMKDLIIRQKDIADGAIPSGNSLAFYDLVRLSRITARQDYALKAEELMKSFAGNISDNPSSYAQFLIGLSFMLGPSKEIVIVGSPQEADFQKLYAQINDPFLPRKVVLHRPYDVTDTDVSVRIAPYIKGQNAMDGKATVFVCENYACKSPVTSPEALMPLLQ